MVADAHNVEPDPNGEGHGEGGGILVLIRDSVLRDDVQCGIGPLEYDAGSEDGKEK